MQAIILAGGLGTRLRPVLAEIPKPMAPIQGEPFLSYLLGFLEAEGFESVTLAVGYRWESIQQYFGRRFGSLAIEYSVEETPRGTGGAIRQAIGSNASGCVFVLNGDSIADADYRRMRELHGSQGQKTPGLSMLVAQVPDTSRFGTVTVEGTTVLAFGEKRGSGPGLINAGVYLLDRAVFQQHQLPERFSFEREWLAPRVSSLRPRAFRANGFFLDIGTPAEYRRAQTEISEWFGTKRSRASDSTD